MAQSSVPKTMKAQVLRAFNASYELSTLPVPGPPTGKDILLRVRAAGFCHTDAVFASGAMGQKLPLIGSHEFAGEVVALGNEVTSPALRVGVRVGSFGRAYRPCGTCWACRNNDGDEKGYSKFCPAAGNLGLTGNGGFQEYAIVDSRQVAVLPGELDFVDAAPLMCAGYTIYCAFQKLGLRAGARVGIIGCGGGLGHLGLQFGTAMGYQMVGVDNQDSTLKLARHLDTGASIFDARVVDPEGLLTQIDGGEVKESFERGLEAVFILPESQRAFDYGFKLLRNNAICMVISFPTQGFHFSARDVVFRGIKIMGLIPGGQSIMQEMLTFAAEHGVRAVRKTFPLADLNDLVQEYNKGEGGKLVVDMDLRTL
jgi:D-arabinose 1-dehydrogenase-like Zn-dependent alcohol dehydrogenase